jgi:hypothetical protein
MRRDDADDMNADDQDTTDDQNGDQDAPDDSADSDQVEDAARQHLADTDPSDTEAHVARQAQNMAPDQADDLASTLLSQARQYGVDVDGLCARFGIDPNQAGGYLSQITGFLHENHPDALAQAAGQEPGIAGLLAHPSVGGVLGTLASRFFGGR